MPRATSGKCAQVKRGLPAVYDDGVVGGGNATGIYKVRRRLAWLRDCGDYVGVSLVLVLVLVGAGAVVWWRVSHEKWGLVRRVVFWVVLVAVLWVLVNFYSVPHPEV